MFKKSKTHGEMKTIICTGQSRTSLKFHGSIKDYSKEVAMLSAHNDAQKLLQNHGSHQASPVTHPPLRLGRIGHTHVYSALASQPKAVPTPTAIYSHKLFHTPGAKPAIVPLSSNRSVSTTRIPSSQKKICLKAIIGQWVAMDENYSSLDDSPTGNQTTCRFQQLFPVNSSFFSQWPLFGHSFFLAIRIWDAFKPDLINFACKHLFPRKCSQ